MFMNPVTVAVNGVVLLVVWPCTLVWALLREAAARLRPLVLPLTIHLRRSTR